MPAADVGVDRRHHGGCGVGAGPVRGRRPGIGAGAGGPTGGGVLGQHAAVRPLRADGEGFAWALVQPIYELLRNPITAVLIIFVIAGSAVLTTQVINAMAGNSDFVYMYEQ